MTRDNLLTLWKCLLAGVLIGTLLLLVGCGSILVRQTDTPPGPPLVLNPDIKGVWCGNLHNLRRITLRFIHALDPQWQSVCPVVEQ